MMTSINPKNANLNNFHTNENDNMVSNTANSLFQRNNYTIEKEGINEGVGNEFKYKANANINYNMNDKNLNPPLLNNYKNMTNQEISSEKILNNVNTNKNLPNNLNLNYNNQNNSINLNFGLQAKKNYSTPILNEGIPGTGTGEGADAGLGVNQDINYNKSFDKFDRNQQKNFGNYGNMNNFSKNKSEVGGNDDFYLSEIDKLKKEIENLKKSNEYLNNQLKEEQKKNEQLFSIQKAKDEGENSILSEISHCLQVSSFEEILPKLNEIINYLNNNVNSNTNKNSAQDSNNKIRDELISKLQKLYLSLTGSNEKEEDITIKILWRWIKHLINTVKQLALEKEKNIEMYQNMQEIDDCKEYCEELISEFNLQSLDELKMFIDNLLKQNNINIMKQNENQPEIRNMPMGRQIPMQAQQQFQVQNYQQDEENEEGEVEGEGEEEVDENENENIDPNQQQYENENDYDENNEMMQQQMEINNQNNPNEGNFNFKYDGNVNQGNEY